MVDRRVRVTVDYVERRYPSVKVDDRDPGRCGAEVDGRDAKQRS